MISSLWICKCQLWDGITATRLIIQKHGENAPKIIAMTANVFLEDKEKCLDAGMCDFMTKPINKELLKENLERIYIKKQLN